MAKIVSVYASSGLVKVLTSCGASGDGSKSTLCEALSGAPTESPDAPQLTFL
jgi:hypothetical protein